MELGGPSHEACAGIIALTGYLRTLAQMAPAVDKDKEVDPALEPAASGSVVRCVLHTYEVCCGTHRTTARSAKCWYFDLHTFLVLPPCMGTQLPLNHCAGWETSKGGRIAAANPIHLHVFAAAPTLASARGLERARMATRRCGWRLSPGRRWSLPMRSCRVRTVGTDADAHANHTPRRA